MLDLVFSHSTIWVHLASVLYIVGFWIRDQLLLRSIVLLGTIFYIVYYYHAAELPLWTAIVWSTALAVVNLYVTIEIALERTTFRMGRDEKHLYGAFASLTPGEFRKLIEPAIWHDTENQTLLTRENSINNSLFCVVDGHVWLQKASRDFRRSS